ncbi:AAA family ATPase [Fictibacillus halophilus]|uniref:AAA family ATPase n=1 Tax=Fictibacillus halophilus TaxID=1610490 RepID=UPI001CFA99AA|nr:AAA family ATPase [Fictibacillus halophilus]
MNRLVIMTVGKTHSGKTTFAKALEKELHNSVVIDQDNHAEFLHDYYQTLLPKQGPNVIKYAITRTIVDYTVNETNCHIIRCNSNRNRKSRLNQLAYYHEKGFTSILVTFEIPTHVLEERIAKNNRSKNVLRVASTFEEVLTRQENETNKGDVLVPIEGEADYLFVIKKPDDIQSVIGKIVNLSQRVGV